RAACSSPCSSVSCCSVRSTSCCSRPSGCRWRTCSFRTCSGSSWSGRGWTRVRQHRSGRVPRRRPTDERESGVRMPSFDVSSKVDLQEVDNAVNQARKELGQRYDFKGSKASIELRKAENVVELVAEDTF